MRAGTGVSPHMRDQFIWNKLSPRSRADVKREAGGSSAAPRGRGSTLPNVGDGSQTVQWHLAQ